MKGEVDLNTEETTTTGEPLLDRETYRKIKKMDRTTLQSLIQDIYDSGRKKGLSESEANTDAPSEEGLTLDLREVEKEIRAIKGIGEKRAEEIMQIFEKHLGV